MPKLINIQTGQPEDVDQNQIGQKFLSGTHAFPRGQGVNLKDESGNPITSDPSDVYDLVTRGNYSFPSGTEIKEHELQQEYNEGLVNKLKGVAQGAVESIPFVGGALVKPFETDEAAKTRRGTPQYLAGQVAGISAQLLAPEAGIASLLGEPAAAISSLGHAAQEILPATEGVLGTLASRAAGSAVEGSLWTAGQLVNEKTIGDPGLTAEQVLAQVGHGAMFGGALGAALAVPGLIRGPVDEAISGLKDSVGEILGNKLGPEKATLEGALNDVNMPEAKKAGIVEGLSKLKPNAEEIKAAADRLGAPLLESQISDSKQVQNLQSMMVQNLTVSGISQAQRLNQGIEVASNAVKDALSTAENMTAAEVGSAIKEGITKKLSSEMEPISQMYDEFKEVSDIIPLSDRAKKQIAKNILEIPELSVLKGSSGESFAKTVANSLEGIDTVDKLKLLRSAIREESKDPKLRYAAGLVQEKLSSLEENSMIRFAEKNFQEDSPIRQRVMDAIETRKSANAKYASIMDDMKEVGGNIFGSKKIYGLGHFNDLIEDVSPEKLAKKLFDTKNSESFKRFQSKFPEEARLLGDLEKNRIANLPAVAKDGKFLANPALKEINKLSPEMRKAIFSEEGIQKIKDAKTYMESIPAKFNPSETSTADAWRKFLTNPLSATAQNISDAAAKKLIEHLVNLHGAEGDKIGTLLAIENASRKTSREIGKTAGQIFSVTKKAVGPAAAMAATGKMDKNERIDQFKDRVREINNISSNPSMLVDNLHSSTEKISPHAPNISSAMQQSTVGAINFLKSKIPQSPPALPLSAQWDPSLSDANKFDKYYRAVDDPISVLHDLKNGTLSQEGVESLNAVHPQLYQQMKSEVMDRLSLQKQRPPYKTRMMLSLFLGQPMDHSLTPQSILGNQTSLNAPSLKNQENVAAPKPSMKGMEKIGQADRMLTPMQKSNQRKE